MRNRTRSKLIIVMVVAAWLSPQPLRAEGPSLPEKQTEEGWFFYHDEKRRFTPIPDDEMDLFSPFLRPDQDLPPFEDIPPPNSKEESKVDPIKPDAVASQESPTSGPKLELWLSGLSDKEMEPIVKKAPAHSLREWVPILMDQALTTLDRPSVRKYLLVQQETLRRSDRFAKIWQEVIWTDPTFDRPESSPFGSLAQQIYDEDKVKTDNDLLKGMAGDISFILIVASNCRACEAQWLQLGIIKDDYGITSKAIASELLTLSDSSLALPYPGVIKALAPPQLPSLYAVSVSTGAMRRLGSGFISRDEVLSRLKRLFTQPEKGDQQYASSPSLPTDQQELPEGSNDLH